MDFEEDAILLGSFFELMLLVILLPFFLIFLFWIGMLMLESFA
jgi:hypothetical protein